MQAVDAKIGGAGARGVVSENRRKVNNVWKLECYEEDCVCTKECCDRSRKRQRGEMYKSLRKVGKRYEK